MDVPKITTPDQAIRFWRETRPASDEVALVRNPSYVACPLELYALAPRISPPLDRIVGIVMDMDGTTTTTEPLCLHSLEWMVRQATGRLAIEDWAGLDPDRDLPHVIGNSTTRHVEYLLQTYGQWIQPAAFARSFVKAVVWTLTCGRDPGRQAEVRANAAALGARDLPGVVNDALTAPGDGDWFVQEPPAVTALADRFASQIRIDSFVDQVRAAIDVYYVRYHMILAALAAGHAESLPRGAVGKVDEPLVAPMPGVAAYLAIIKGALGADAAALYELLATHVRHKTGRDPIGTPGDLAAIGRWFQANPCRVAVVTSSIRYEADIVLAEVFARLRDEVAAWPIDTADRARIAATFAGPDAFYDAVVTASDSSEIRLKPHRDLYSIALHRMGVPRNEYDAVVGFEDSESGVIAIRAAGIGCCIALPFAQSAGHDLRAAVAVLSGQLPEVLLDHHGLLSAGALASCR